MAKTPYMIIVGDKEAETGEVSLRTKSGKILNNQKPGWIIEQITSEIKSRSLKGIDIQEVSH